MSTTLRSPALAPFQVRSFRFQWPSDLAASWALEMETLILGWYVLVETGSVLLLTLFASLQYVGTLLSPLFGVTGHRLGNKRMFCAMRATYAALGIGPSYVVVTAFYAASLLLTLGVAGSRPAARSADSAVLLRPSAWQDLKEGLAYVRKTPPILAAIYLALLVNLTAFPLVNGLLPYVAKDIYGTDQTGLGYLVAGFAGGALLGSIVLTRFGHAIRPARMMIIGCATWSVLTLLFAQMHSLAGGLPLLLLLLAGLVAQSLGMVPLAAILLRSSEQRFRGRVMGINMLVIYTLPIGLLASGPLIESFGFRAMATVYCLFGLAFTLLIAVRWRAHVWRSAAPANAR